MVFLENTTIQKEDVSWKQSITVLLLGMDMIGGVVTNSTNSAKRWYHRPTQTIVDHMMFIAIHAIQIGLVSILFVDVSSSSTSSVVDKAEEEKEQLQRLQFQYFGLVYISLLISSLIVLTVPKYLQRPTSMALVATSIPLSMLQNLPKTPGLEWFVPLLFLKLLVSHLTYEETTTTSTPSSFHPTTTSDDTKIVSNNGTDNPKKTRINKKA